MSELARLCEAHGIAPTWHAIDGTLHHVPEETLRVLADAFDIENVPPLVDGGIEAALDNPMPAACFVPEELREARVWGATCQLGSLRSARNAGMGDFADLAALCRVVAEAGGDFVGLNPLHALFWSDPGRASPFSPSNRSALNPLYLALDWIGGAEPTKAEEAEMARLRATDIVDLVAVHAVKDAVLRRAFEAAAKNAVSDDPAVLAHARFEALSGRMVMEGHGAGWMSWPEEARRDEPLAREVAYHAWLQRQAAAQLDRVNREAHAAGLRIGLYLDLAVGVAPDGSATWSDPDLTVPGIKIGAPPDPFSAEGQDWGLAPLSPTVLAEREGRPFAEMMRAVMRHAGAVRVDHAMALARLFLIPDGAPAMDGAYARYPLGPLLKALADVSNEARCIVIGEDLGVVPPGFREVMSARDMHAYKVFWFEREDERFHDPAGWAREALACVGTHDTATFAGWWTGHDNETRRAIGWFSDEDMEREEHLRARDRDAVRRHVGWREGVAWRGEDVRLLSTIVHDTVARSPCRLAALQLDDALGVLDQANMPGTTHEYPNWRRKLPVAVEDLAKDEGFRAHAKLMREARPK